MAEVEKNRVCLHGEDVWAGYERGGPAHDGDWEFIGTKHCPGDPSSAARLLCASKWTGGTHAILVVSAQEAHEYRITLETEKVDA